METKKKEENQELSEERIREIVKEEISKAFAEQAAFSLRSAWGEEAFARFRRQGFLKHLPLGHSESADTIPPEHQLERPSHERFL